MLLGFGVVKIAKAQKTEVLKKKNKSSLLWKVSGNGLEKPSYVYGTIHLICEADFSLRPAVKEAFEETEVTMLELDLDDPNMAVEAQKHALNPTGENFSKYLEENEKKALNDFFTKEYGADLTQLGMMRPIGLVSLIITKMMTCGTKSYEAEFVKMSKEAGKEVLGLETIGFQMGVLDGIDTETQAEWLAGMILDKDKQSDDFSKMTSAYQANDLEALYKVVSEAPEMEKFKKPMLDDRNADWIAKMETQMKKQSTFFGVGAAHLPSDTGVIELLKAKGYKVEPVKL